MMYGWLLLQYGIISTWKLLTLEFMAIFAQVFSLFKQCIVKEKLPTKQNIFGIVQLKAYFSNNKFVLPLIEIKLIWKCSIQT